VPYGTIGGIFFSTLSNEMFGLGVISFHFFNLLTTQAKVGYDRQ
jgi:hypothetical protein